MNPYNVLGVEEKADKTEIKKAFRGLSMKWHPDKNKNDPAAMSKFQQINSAYEILSDDHKRRDYDTVNQFNHIFGQSVGGGGGGGGFGQPGGGFEQLFKTRIFMGGCDPFSGGIDEMLFSAFLPPPIEKQIGISLVQAYNGASVPIEIERMVNHRRVEKETIYVPIVKGVDHGETIIIKQKGNITNNIKGDVQFTVTVMNDPKFERSGLDFIVKQTISLKESLFGFVIDFVHINGKNYKLKNDGHIIQNQHRKTIPGMGLTRDGVTGAMILVFEVETPTNLSTEKMTLLKELL